VFITECEFVITEMEGTPSTEWLHASSSLTHRSVKPNLIIINYNL